MVRVVGKEGAFGGEGGMNESDVMDGYIYEILYFVLLYFMRVTFRVRYRGHRLVGVRILAQVQAHLLYTGHESLRYNVPSHLG